jgi:hypothetical protein
MCLNTKLLISISFSLLPFFSVSFQQNFNPHRLNKESSQREKQRKSLQLQLKQSLILSSVPRGKILKSKLAKLSKLKKGSFGVCNEDFLCGTKAHIVSTLDAYF